MEILDKLAILSDAAKYDVACTSSGVARKGKKGATGSTALGGICHSFSADGRCISLLKILMTNHCIYDCQYCVNRRSNDIPRAAFTPQEIAELTINFYKRNYIEGLFLSSAVIRNPDYTMELLYKTLWYVRTQHRFNGYIHVKAIPGANEALITKTGLLADRMSCNIELPSEKSLQLLAPDKPKKNILTPMKILRNNIDQNKNEITVYRHAPKFVPAGQSTQMIVGATDDSDQKIVRLAEGLYQKFQLKRVFYSAFLPVQNAKVPLPTDNPPLAREHRLYQADWLMRFYQFSAEEIVGESQFLDLTMDPKCSWALQHLDEFPVEINRADEKTLLRVPGIGVQSVKRILLARRHGKLNFTHLKKMGIVLKRARYFITCDGKMLESKTYYREHLEMKLKDKQSSNYQQLTLFDPKPAPLLLGGVQNA